MNAARIPTAAQQSWAQADTYARCQADGDSLRRDFRADAREPVKHLRVVPDAATTSPRYSEDRVLAYFVVAVAIVFAVKHFWGIV